MIYTEEKRPSIADFAAVPTAAPAANPANGLRVSAEAAIPVAKPVTAPVAVAAHDGSILDKMPPGKKREKIISCQLEQSDSCTEQML